MTVDQNGTVVQKDDYYPFGLTFQSWQLNPPKNLHGFQGQEYQEETQWHQYKWRNADPALGRFFNVDPLAEDYVYNSPYAFIENHVTAHVELEGLEKEAFMKAMTKDNVVEPLSRANSSAKKSVKLKGGVQAAGLGVKAKVGNFVQVTADGKAFSLSAEGNTEEVKFSATAVSTEFGFQFGSNVKAIHKQDDLKSQLTLDENGVDGDFKLRDGRGDLKAGNFKTYTNGEEAPNNVEFSLTFGTLSGGIILSIDKAGEFFSESGEAVTNFFNNLINTLSKPESEYEDQQEEYNQNNQ